MGSAVGPTLFRGISSPPAVIALVKARWYGEEAINPGRISMRWATVALTEACYHHPDGIQARSWILLAGAEGGKPQWRNAPPPWLPTDQLQNRPMGGLAGLPKVLNEERRKKEARQSVFRRPVFVTPCKRFHPATPPPVPDRKSLPFAFDPFLLRWAVSFHQEPSGNHHQCKSPAEVQPDTRPCRANAQRNIHIGERMPQPGVEKTEREFA